MESIFDCDHSITMFDEELQIDVCVECGLVAPYLTEIFPVTAPPNKGKE